MSVRFAPDLLDTVEPPFRGLLERFANRVAEYLKSEGGGELLVTEASFGGWTFVWGGCSQTISYERAFDHEEHATVKKVVDQLVLGRAVGFANARIQARAKATNAARQA